MAHCESGQYVFYDDGGALVDPSTTALCQRVSLSVAAPNLIETYETAALADFTGPVRVSLTAPPTGTVVIQAVINDTSEVTVSPPNLTFTAATYDAAQDLTFTPVLDNITDGDVPWTLTLSVVASTETLTPQPFASLAPIVLNGMSFDAEGLAVAPRPLLTSSDEHKTTESDTFGVEYFHLSLSSEPAADTVVTCVSDDLGEGVVVGSSAGQPDGIFVFVAANWSVPVRVGVQGVPDDVVEATGNFSVSCTASAPCTATDTTAFVTCFNGATSSTFALKNYDTNQLGVVVTMNSTDGYVDDVTCLAQQPEQLESCPMTPAGCGFVELVQGAAPVTVSVALTSQPYTVDSVVVITPTAVATTSDPTTAAVVEGAVEATSATFTATNWDIPQEISISAVVLESTQQPDLDVAITIVFAVDASLTTDTGYGGTFGGYADCVVASESSSEGGAACFNLKYGGSADTQQMCGLFRTNLTRITLVEVPAVTEPSSGLSDEAIYGIIGGILGFVIILILIVLIIICEREKKIRKERESEALAKNARLDAADEIDIDFRVDDEDDLDIDHLASQLSDAQRRLSEECAKLKAENDVLSASVGRPGVGATMEESVDPTVLVRQIRELKVRCLLFPGLPRLCAMA